MELLQPVCHFSSARVLIIMFVHNITEILFDFLKVAAIEDSSEYRLGIRRNARMNSTGRFLHHCLFPVSHASNSHAVKILGTV